METGRSTARGRVPKGLLVSQIGYDRDGCKAIVYRGGRDALSASAGFEAHGPEGRCCVGGMDYWGERWGSHWWVGTFTELERCGLFTVYVKDRDEIVDWAMIRVGEQLLYRKTWEAVSIGQAERRQWMIESKSGWFDAGMLWQEANSHAAYLFGLCDLRERKGAGMEPETRERLDRQIVNGCGYLATLQDMALEKGYGDGGLVHQAFGFDTVTLTGDVSKAAAAWARAASVVGSDVDASTTADWRARARRALRWLESPRPTDPVVFNGFAYGDAEARTVPEGTASTDLLLMMEAEWHLADGRATEAVERWANELIDRQVGQGETGDAFYGMFRQYPGSNYTVKAWTHGMLEGKVMPTDLGNTLGFYLFPLLRLARAEAGGALARRCREALEAFAYGLLLPGCEGNPFKLCPNGHFPGQGALNFAGLWHGCNAIYGIAAALARELAELLDDERFDAIADGNLQWIAGLNAGLTRETLRSCILWDADVGEGEAAPVSMIQGIGERTAGNWMNIRGSICNGFSVGEQFQWDVAAEAANDGPNRFTDEDWITHAGGWLMAIARERGETFSNQSAIAQGRSSQANH